MRYLAWTALHQMQAKAEPALLGLWKDENPRMRARALWLLGKIDGKGQAYVDLGPGGQITEASLQCGVNFSFHHT